MAITSTLTASLTSGLTSALVGLGGAVNALRTIAVHNPVNDLEVSSTGRDRAVTRWPIVIGADSATLLLSFCGWRLTNTAEVDLANGYTIEGAALENSAGTLVKRITFDGGSNTKAVAAGDNDIQSDELSASEFSLSQFSKGELYWLKVAYAVPSTSDVLPGNSCITSAKTGSQVAWYADGATTPSDILTAGVWTVASGSGFGTTNTGPRPMVLGRPSANAVTWFQVGDSIGQKDNDDVSPHSYAEYGVGYFHRAMASDRTASNLWASINFARGGAKLQTFADGANTKWQTFMQYARFGHIEGGINDTAAGRNLTQLQGDFDTIYGLFGGFDLVGASKIGPRCTSTDSFVTTANQTYASAADQPSGVNDNYNTWLDSYGLDFVCDMDAVRDATFPLKWKVDGNPFTYTDDGLHPTPLGHTDLGTELRADMDAAVETLIPDTVPAAVSDLAATAGNAEVALTWTAPDNGGDAITDYVVEYKESSSGTWLTFSDGTSASTGATVTGLTNATEYNFRVKAVNGVGTGSASNTATATPVAAFNPLDLAPVFVFDFRETSTITKDGSNLVSQVDDLEGNGYSLTEVLSYRQPQWQAGAVNGEDAINFNYDGTSSHMTLTASLKSLSDAANEIYFVIKSSDTSNQQYVMQGGTGNLRWGIWYVPGSTVLGVANTATANTHLHTITPSTDTSLVGLRRNGSDIEALYRGTTSSAAKASNASSAITSIYIGSDSGGGNQLRGHIAYIIGFDKVLTSTERANLATYCSDVWGAT